MPALISVEHAVWGCSSKVLANSVSERRRNIKTETARERERIHSLGEGGIERESQREIARRRG